MVKISRDYHHFFFRKKLFLNKFAFSWSHDNKSKNYPIVLKFGTDVAFIHLQDEFVAQKNRSITKKDMKRFTSIVPARGARAPNRAISNSCLLY